jgi:DNA replication protein DnaC
MDIPDFSRSQALNNIPKKKLQEFISDIKKNNTDLSIQNIKLTAINRYAESNIPIEYWTLKMDKDFYGDPRLLAKYNEYVSDLKSAYDNGTSICFSGNHGVGKSLTASCILKRACEKNYTCLYSTLSDIVNVLTSGNSEDKFLAQKELILVDFLVIDEWDTRFVSSDSAADLYARSLESVFRTRSQNKLPTLMCTNSPNIIESFNGSLKASMGSLMSGYLKMFPVFGKDYRQNK